MILSFTRKLDWGELTEFERKIASGEKTHTFRFDMRWKPGRTIHFWMGSPRAKKYLPAPYPIQIPGGRAIYWNDDKPPLPICSATEEFTIDFSGVNYEDKDDLWEARMDFLWIGGNQVIDQNRLRYIANRDGLTVDQFRRFFFLRLKKEGIQKKTGKIIHWMDEYYEEETVERYAQTVLNG